MAEKIVQIRSGPGIKRDGTKFEGDSYVDGQWVRWQRGLPRKMGGTTVGIGVFTAVDQAAAQAAIGVTGGGGGDAAAIVFAVALG